MLTIGKRLFADIFLNFHSKIAIFYLKMDLHGGYISILWCQARVRETLRALSAPHNRDNRHESTFFNEKCTLSLSFPSVTGSRSERKVVFNNRYFPLTSGARDREEERESVCRIQFY